MDTRSTLDMQLFADGDGGGEAAPGETTADAGQDTQARLLELGVPADRLRRQSGRAGARAAAAPAADRETPPAAGGGSAAPPARLSWDEILADPEYNSQMQGIVRSRLKSAKGAQESLAALAPAISALARRYGLDPANPDHAALARAISGDRALTPGGGAAPDLSGGAAPGLSGDAAPGLSGGAATGPSGSAAPDREDALTGEDAPPDGDAPLRQYERERRAYTAHRQELARQGEALRQLYPSFDLERELQNPVFARMTAPNMGLSVEDAYYAIHRRELQNAALQVTAQKAVEKLSKAVMAGSIRPREAGAGAQAPSTLSFDYSKATQTQRDAIKQRIRDAAARGEKLYPGG